MKRMPLMWSALALAIAQGAGAAGESEAPAAPSAFGAITVRAPSSASAAIGEGGPRDNWGLYLRGGGLFNFYADPDFEPDGFSDRSVDLDPSLGFAGALGYRFWNFSSADEAGMGFRIEGEATFEFIEADDELGGLEDLTIYGFAGNGYFDLVLAPRWTWYIGGGVGLADVDPTGPSGRDNPLFLQAMTGFGYTWGGALSAYGGIRVRGYDDSEFSDGKLSGLATGSVELGLMVSF